MGQGMKDSNAVAGLYFGMFFGFLLGMFIVYMGNVKGNLLLPEKDYACIDAEPIDKDPSIVACTIILRKGSTAYKKYLELGNDTRI